MPTNRTASRRWVKLRARLMRQAIRNGTFRCVECDKPLDPKAKPNTEFAAELDHVIPYAERPDLEYDPSNLVWRCHPHNRRKSNKRDERERVPTTRRW